MPVKDLYYQKYLKYKNKYLNLQNQIGGGNYLITTTANTITIDYDQNKGARSKEDTEAFIDNFSNPNINTIKLQNFNKYDMILYNIIKTQPRLFDKITKLIVDNNELSNVYVVSSLGLYIIILTNVSNFSFDTCNLTEKTAEYLYVKLLNLRRQITNINLINNDLSKEMLEKFKNINDKKLSKQTEYSDKHTPPPHISSSTDGDGYIIDS